MSNLLERDQLGELELLRGLEWLETDGLGGWASSTVAGLHSRRYHGLLVAATAPPVDRRVLLSRLDETVRLGGASHALAANDFPGAVYPRGFELLTRFERNPFPSWTYQMPGARLVKTIVSLHGESTRLVLYELAEANGEIEIELLPFFAGRDIHALRHADQEVNRTATFEHGVLRYRQTAAMPEVSLSVPGARFEAAPDWWFRFEYAVERERGFDWQEDLFTPGRLIVRLAPGARLGVIVSTAGAADRDAFALAAAEGRRRAALLARAGNPDPLVRALVLAADQFLVRRGAPEQGLASIIAGYPWFADWGRDAMIALPGLCLTTRRFAEAKAILRAFAAATDAGMLPNRFPDVGAASVLNRPEYNTVDATLWFFVAVWRYLGAAGDAAFVESELLPVLGEILAWHARGTRYGIRIDRDGLLLAGEPGVQLTWMDAKVGDWVVTPRHGKPVEVEALWINALWIYGQLLRRFRKEAEGDALLSRVARLRERFATLFWNDEAGTLFDCIDGETRDDSVRPNALFALSLPLPLLAGARAERLLATVEAKLLTPCGLRSLAPEDPRYRPIYAGGPLERDGAYHQGTVWSWLLGPYLTALVRLRGEVGRHRGREILAAFTPHLGQAALGTVSEIFDAEPPHLPRGACAQAWSVAELLRAAVEDLHLGEEAP